MLARSLWKYSITTNVMMRAVPRCLSYQAPAHVNREIEFRMGFKADQVATLPLDVQKILHFDNAAQPEINKMQIQKAIEAFQRFPGDTGSSEVQVAVLTQKIKRSTEHAKEHKKDHHSRRGLIAMVNKRRKLLMYLRKEDLQKYKAVVAALGLRFN